MTIEFKRIQNIGKFRCLGLLCLLVNLFLNNPIQSQVISNDGMVISLGTAGTITTKDIKNNSGEVANSGTIELTGNWDNSATYTPGTGTLRFSGSTSQSLTASSGSEDIYKLEVENSGSTQVSINNHVKILNQLKIEDGQLEISTYNLINEGTSYINGTLSDNSTNGINQFHDSVTITGNGVWDFLSANSDVEFRGGLQNSGGFYSGSGTYTFSTNTQNLNGIAPITFHGHVNLQSNAIVNSSGTITIGDAALDEFNIFSGEFNTGSSVFTASAKVIVNGTLSDKHLQGTNKFEQLVTLNSGSHWDFSGNSPVEFQNSLVHNGSTFNSGTGLYKFTTLNQSLEGSSEGTFLGNVLIDNNITLTNRLYALAKGATFKGKLDGAGSGSRFVNEKVTSYEYPSEQPMNTGILDASNSGNRFRYSGNNNQSLASGSEGIYDTLELSGSGIKTILGNLLINKNLYIYNSTLSFHATIPDTAEIKGNLLASAGAIDMRPGTNIDHLLKLFGDSNQCNTFQADDNCRVEYLGGDQQQVFGSPGYSNIRFAGTGKKVMQGNVTASGNQIDLETIVDAQEFELYLSLPAVLIHRTLGVVIGKLIRKVDASNYEYYFPVGTDTTYNPFYSNFSELSQGDLSVRFVPDSLSPDGLPLLDNGVDVWNQFKKGYWQTRSRNSLSSQSYTIAVVADGFGLDGSSRLVKRESNSSFPDGDFGEVVGDSISRENLDGISNESTIFFIARGRPNVAQQPRDTATCQKETVVFRINATGHGILTYQWYDKNNNPLDNNAKYQGTTTNELKILDGQDSDDGNYYCIVKDASGHEPKTTPKALVDVRKIPLITHNVFDNVICTGDTTKIKIMPSAGDTTYTWNVNLIDDVFGASDGVGIDIIQKLQRVSSVENVGKVVYRITATGPKHPTLQQVLCQSQVDNTVKVLPKVSLVLKDTTYIGGNNIRCFGMEDTVKLFSSGGALSEYPSYSTNGYQFKWYRDNVLDTTSRNLKAPIGNYRVDVEDQEGCKATAYHTFTQPTELKVDIKVVSEISCSDRDGVIEADTVNSGSIKPYKYFWNDTEGAETRTQSEFYSMTLNKVWAEIPYRVTITDTNNCVALSPQKIYDINISKIEKRKFSSFSFRDTSYEVSCADSATGYFEVNIPNNDRNLILYLYNSDIQAYIDTVLRRPNEQIRFSNLKPGNYKVTGKDGKCDLIEADVELRSRSQIKIDTSLSYYMGYQVSCHDSTNGSIAFNAKGGTNRFRYNLDYYNNGSFVPYQTNLNSDPKLGWKYSKLGSGQYRVVARDSILNEETQNHATCVARKEVTLKKPDSIQLAFQVSDLKCFNDSTGSIAATYLGGGVGNKTYLWDNTLGKIVSGTISANNLQAGQYRVKATYGLGCITTFNPVEVKEPKPFVSTIANIKEYNGFQISCYNSTNGQITGTASGGTRPFTFQWLSDQTIISNDSVADQLKVGKYQMIVLDKNNCRAELESKITKVPDSISAVLKSDQSISCKGFSDGQLFVDEIKGGAGNYTFGWHHNPSLTNSFATNLAAGNYSVTITDQNDCQLVKSREMKEPHEMIVNIDVDTKTHNGYHVSCKGSSDAKIYISSIQIGNFGGYTSIWNTNETTDTIQSKPTGVYRVIVTDTKGCQAQDSVEVGGEYEPTELALSIGKVEFPSCPGDEDGYAESIAEGGAGGYKYLWNDPLVQQTAKADSLHRGFYTVFVRDRNNCKDSATVTIDERDLLQLSEEPEIQKPYCPESEDGSIKIKAKGGTGSLAYSWNNGENNNIIRNLDEGSYIFVIEDILGCTFTDTIDLYGVEGSCLDVPNAFSPNGDGTNDRWEIMVGDPEKELYHISQYYPEAEIYVLNRWGEVVYRSPKGYNEAWDGTNKTLQLPMDSYYYVIDLKNGTEPTKGVISIIR